MPRILPLPVDALCAEDQALIAQAEQFMGFQPHDALTMAHVPGLVGATAHLVQTVLAGGTVDPALKRMVGLAASVAAGCEYCQAHSHFSARELSVPTDILRAIVSGDYRALGEREAAAIRVAAGSAHTGMDAGSADAGVSDADFAVLQQYFTDPEIAELVAVMALYGFLNRWNKTLQTDIEQQPAACPLPKP